MDIRAQLEERLMEYVQDTLSYIKTIRDFCDQEQKWTSERKTELEKMRDINENQQEEEEKELGTVLKDTLEGLKKLEPFLDAVEKLTVTSSYVFSGQIFLLCGESPERVQSVISDARIDARLLILFRRDAETFFQPRLDNVHILVFQLRNYVLETKQLCSTMRSSVLCGDIYKCKTGQPLVELILNASEGTMNQMLDNLNQLQKIRMNQDTRLAFLFQENAQKFIDVFSEHHSKMWQFLKDLEETAVKLDSMKLGGSISTVVGSSVGIAAGGFGIAAVLAPFTAGASLAWAFAVAGIGLGVTSAVNTVVTGITETAVNRHHERNAQSYIKSYKDDMIKIEDCLKEVVNSEGPLVQLSAVDVMTVLHGAGEGLSKTVDGFAAYAGHKSERVTLAETEFAREELNTASDAPQVVINLSRTGPLANAKTLRIVKASRFASGFVNVFFIGLDGYIIYKESRSLANGSESEVSKLIRSRAALWRSELEAWEKMYHSLCIGIKTISESRDALEKPFLP